MDLVTEATAEMVILSAGIVMQAIDIKQEVITKTMKTFKRSEDTVDQAQMRVKYYENIKGENQWMPKK